MEQKKSLAETAERFLLTATQENAKEFMWRLHDYLRRNPDSDLATVREPFEECYKAKFEEGVTPYER